MIFSDGRGETQSATKDIKQQRIVSPRVAQFGLELRNTSPELDSLHRLPPRGNWYPQYCRNGRGSSSLLMVQRRGTPIGWSVDFALPARTIGRAGDRKGRMKTESMAKPKAKRASRTSAPRKPAAKTTKTASAGANAKPVKLLS